MATPMCISDDGNKATFIGTFMETGDNVRLCDECMPNFCAAVFERMTGVDMTPAIFLASQEGQEGGPVAEGSPGEVAYPPDMEPAGRSDVDPTPVDSGRSVEPGVAHGAPSSEPPGPAPADPDEGAGASPTSEDSQTAGGPPAALQSSSERPAVLGESPPVRVSRAKSRAA